MAEPNEYKISVFFSEEDEAYIANIDNWKYISAHGESPEEAIKQLSVAVGGVRKIEEERGSDGQG